MLDDLIHVKPYYYQCPLSEYTSDSTYNGK